MGKKLIPAIPLQSQGNMGTPLLIYITFFRKIKWKPYHVLGHCTFFHFVQEMHSCKGCWHIQVVIHSCCWPTAHRRPPQWQDKDIRAVCPRFQCKIKAGNQGQHMTKDIISLESSTMNALPSLFCPILLPTITTTSLPRISTSLPEMSWAEMHVSMKDIACSWAFIHPQCLGFPVLGQNICLGFRFTSCAFFLCPETLSRQNLKNTCLFGLNFLMFSSPEGMRFPVRKWDKIKKTQTHGSRSSYDIDGQDASSLGKHFHPFTSISITCVTNWTPLQEFTLVSANPSSALLLSSCLWALTGS